MSRWLCLCALLVVAFAFPAKASASYKWHPADWWLDQAVCVHQHEGAWNDPDPLYYGGLQFNSTFEWQYNPWARSYYGHANRWPIHAQLHAAWRAYHGWQSPHGWMSPRGWTPWPNTARACGLL